MRDTVQCDRGLSTCVPLSCKGKKRAGRERATPPVSSRDPLSICPIVRKVGAIFRKVWLYKKTFVEKQKSAVLIEFKVGGTKKSLSIAKKSPEAFPRISEQVRPSIRKMKGCSRNSPQKVHANFAQNLGRRILGNTFSGLMQILADSPSVLEIQACGGHRTPQKNRIEDFLQKTAGKPQIRVRHLRSVNLGAA